MVHNCIFFAEVETYLLTDIFLYCNNRYVFKIVYKSESYYYILRGERFNHVCCGGFMARKPLLGSTLLQIRLKKCTSSTYTAMLLLLIFCPTEKAIVFVKRSMCAKGSEKKSQTISNSSFSFYVCHRSR